MTRASPLARLGLGALCALAALLAIGLAGPGGVADAPPSPLLFSTYLGGFGSDWPHAVEVGGDGRVYVAGYTDSTNFPTTSGAYRRTLAGGFDVYVACIAANGSAIEWATLVGGRGEDMPWDIDVDTDGRVWVVGHTGSSDFPTSWGAPYATRSGARDAFVLRLSAGGSALEFSTFLGGEAWEKATAVALSAEGVVWVAGETNSSFFPTTAGAYDRTFGGMRDAFIAKMDGDAIVAATYWGGSEDEQEPVVAVDGMGRPCVAMASASADIPYGQSKGARDAVLVRFDEQLTGIEAGRSVGGLGSDIPRSLQFGWGGRLLVAGYTFSPDFPTTGTDFGAFFGGVADGMVYVVSEDWGTVELSLLLGGTNFDVARAAFFDQMGHLVVAGYTNSTDLPVTADAFDGTKSHDDHDVFLMEIDPGAETLAYGTYVGGGDGDYAMDMAPDRFGVPVVVAYTHSSDFPMGRQGFDRSFNGDGDALVMKFSRDVEPPVLYHHMGSYSDPYPVTGRWCLMGTDARDESGIETVWLEYRFDDGESATTGLPLNPAGPPEWPIYRTSIDVPLAARRLYVRYHARDGVGLENSTEWMAYDVHDSIRPWFVEDRSPLIATTGGEVTFWVKLADNIGLAAVHVDRSQGNLPHQNLTMAEDPMRPGVYTATSQVSNMSVDPISYRFTFQDESGWWNWTAFRDIEVEDDEPPIVHAPSGPDHIEPSVEVDIIVHVSDNIGVVSGVANYTFDGVHFVVQPYDPLLGSTMVLKLDVPEDELQDLFVEFLAYDAAGNEGRATLLVPNEDRTPPELELEPVANTTVTGGQVSIRASAYDEWGIAMIWVRWRFGEGAPQLHESPGTIVLEWTIDVPVDSIAPLHLSVGARDRTMNAVELPTIVVVVVDDRPPVAVAPADVVVRARTPAVLNDGGSTDNIGVVRYEWLFEEEATGLPMVIVGPRFNMTFTRPGDHLVRLIVHDAANNSAMDSVTVTVTAEEGDGPPPVGTYTAVAIVAALALLAVLVALGRRRGKGS